MRFDVSSADAGPASGGVRLSDKVRFSRYDLTLTPNFENFTFQGRVLAYISVTEPTREITLHAADLEIQEAQLWCDKGLGDGGYTPSEIRVNKDSETVTFVFDKDIEAGPAIFIIDYTGTLNDKMVGFYRSKYIAQDGSEKYLATTQFEATDARRALPCVDEPAAKAVFNVRFIVSNDLATLSNMPVSAALENPDGRDGYKLVDFATTPVMSTYLLAFIVGDLEYVEGFTKNGTRVRVYTVPGKKEQGRFALDVAIRTLDFYNEYFGIPYPLPKLDMVAIPDFAAGAMENWGLVTYRENAVLIDPANSSAAAKQRVAEVVAHELAHQWFGNLVTMEWWTNLWLNEGFATWMASFALDHLFPEWDIWTQFLSDEYASALSLDSLRSSHPIEVPVNHPNEISQIFDAISYSKGASVISMIHDFIGAEAFRKGLQIYLNRFAYGNAVTEDLWAALGEASGQPVREMMDTWTKQAGYPLVRVCPYGNDTYSLKQERFLAGGEELTDDERGQSWRIPLLNEFCSDSGASTKDKKVMDSRHLAILTPVTDGAYLKLNSGQVALVRVAYPHELFWALVRAVRDGKLGPADRYGLVSDTLALVRAGKALTGHLINLLPAYRREDNYTVWTAVVGALGALGSILEETELEKRFNFYARQILKGIADDLGWEPGDGGTESHATQLLRGMVLGAYGAFGDSQTVARAASMFDDSLRCGSLDPNLRATVYGLVAKYCDDHVLADFIRLYEKETLQEEKVRLLNAMGRFSTPAVLYSVLDYAFNSGKVRSGDFFYVLGGLASHAKGRRAAWFFLKDNWTKVSERYSGGGLKLLSRVVALTCDGFARYQDADDIEAFFKENPAPSATRAIAESLERIRVRAAWYERAKTDLDATLPLLAGPSSGSPLVGC